jgi:hypothetical protein
MKINIPVVYEPSADPAVMGLWTLEVDRCDEGCHALIAPGEALDHEVWHEQMRSRLEVRDA